MSIACSCTRNTFIYHSSRRSNLETWRNIIGLQQHQNISKNYPVHRKNVIRSVGSSGSSTPPTPSSDTKKVPENKINEAPLSKSTQLTEKASQISEQTYKILEIFKATSKVLTERATLYYTDKRNYLTNAKILNPEGEDEHWYSARVNFLMKRYENFVGLTDVKNAQARVQKTEKLFITSQDDRRETQRLLNEVQGKIKNLHTELERTHRGEEKYLELVTLEHQVLREERNMTEQLTRLEKDEREVFSNLSRAVRNSHESERAQAEKTKYWAVLGSVIGTTLGVMGTTINNRLRMRELRQIVRDATATHGQTEIGTIGAAALTIAASNETPVMEQSNEQPISIETEVVTELQNKMEEFVKQVESFENLTSEKITEVSNSIFKLSENLSEQQNKSTEALSLLERRPVTIPKGEILPDTINKKDIIILQKSLETQIMLWEEKVDGIMKAHLEKSDSSKSLNALERKVTQVLAFEKEMIENTARMYHDHNRSIKIGKSILKLEMPIDGGRDPDNM
jgi:hypothetical protein